MEKTKKYSLIFVVICFLGIGIGTIYNSSQSPSTQVEEDQKITVQENDDSITNQSDTDKKETEKTDTVEEKKNTETNTEQKTTQSKEKKNKQKTDSSTTTETTPKQEESVKHEETPEIKKLKTSLKITGVDTVIGEGEVEIEDGYSVYDVLKTYASQNSLTLNTTGFGSIIYVKGINGLNEFDHGQNSGWLYLVNGVQPTIGAGSYKVKDGDHIEWNYSIR